MRVVAAIVSLVFCVQSTTASVAEDEDCTVFRGATIYSANGPAIENGALLICGGKIIGVGKIDEISVPDGATVRNVGGRVIIPGLVDSHSHLGVYSRPSISSNSDGNEMSGPIQGSVRAIDSVNPLDPGIKMAQAGGVTTANVMPGSGNVIGGQTVYVKLRGDSIEEMQIQADGVVGGLKMANGENPKKAYGGKNQAPMTRMKVASLQRNEFIKAREYMRKWQRYRETLAKDDSAAPPDLDLALQPLVEVLEGKRTVHFHSHRSDDILTVLRHKEEFGFDLVLQHGTESYKILPQIAAAKVPVSMTFVDSPGGKSEVMEFIEACGAELAAAGVPVHVNTDDPVTESRFLLRTAATPVRGGLDTATALKSVTLFPAQALRLAHRVGSLEPGKDADFVVLSGGPFSVYTRVLETWIDGKSVFDLSNEKQRLYQTGGFALSDTQNVPTQPQLVAPRSSVSAPAVPIGKKTAIANDREFVVLARRLHTVTNGTIENGAVHVRDGRILFAGSNSDSRLPTSLPVFVAAEVTPGLIDAHSVVPLNGALNIGADQDADERTDPNQADARALDAFNPSEPLLRFLLEQGVTVIHATPGHANVIAGQTGVFRTYGNSADAMTIRFPQALLFNLGVSPKESYKDKAPATRMGTAALLRNALQAATNYRRKHEAASKKTVKEGENDLPGRDLKLESLGLALSQKIPAIFAAHQAEDLQTALRLAREYNLKPILALATEGYLIREQLKSSSVPIIVHPTMQRVGGWDTYNSFTGNAAALADAGLTIAICSSFESYVPKTRVVRWEAGMGMVYGLGFDRALKAVTLDAAKILNIDKDYGSLDNGKVADLVLYDGDPFEHSTHVTHVIHGGQLVHSRDAAKARALSLDRSQIQCTETGCCASY